jgi:hypothetical protein
MGSDGAAFHGALHLARAKSKSCARQHGRAANPDVVGVARLAIAKTFEA